MGATRRIHVKSPDEMQEIGVELGRAARAGDVIALIGDLGAGKTELVKGIARGLGIDGDPVTSPTFTLMQTYRGGRLLMHHVDLYRLEQAKELVHVGLDALYREE